MASHLRYNMGNARYYDDRCPSTEKRFAVLVWPHGSPRTVDLAMARFAKTALGSFWGSTRGIHNGSYLFWVNIDQQMVWYDTLVISEIFKGAVFQPTDCSRVSNRGQCFMLHGLFQHSPIFTAHKLINHSQPPTIHSQPFTPQAFHSQPQQGTQQLQLWVSPGWWIEALQLRSIAS